MQVINKEIKFSTLSCSYIRHFFSCLNFVNIFTLEVFMN